MTEIVLLHKKTDSVRLEDIRSEMHRRGPPKIRASQAHGRWYAHEGTHRLTIASEEGIPVEFLQVPWKWTRNALEKARYRTTVVKVKVL